MPVSFLTAGERERLRGFPLEIPSEDLNIFFTLSASDLAQIEKQRGDHNRLGFALQLCALRYLGFSPDDLNAAPSNAVAYIAGQLGITPNALKSYGDRRPTRTEHFQQIQTYLGFLKASQVELKSLSQWLIERALEHDKPMLLFQLACEKLRRDKIIRPGVIRLEQMVATARYQAQSETFNRVNPLLTKERSDFLDGLLILDSQKKRTLLSWLRRTATSNSAIQILANLEKFKFLKKVNVDQWDLSMLNPNRLKFLAQIGRKSTNQYLQRLTEQRRYPILLATLKQSLIDITDEIIEMYDRCLWECYTDAKDDLEAFEKASHRSMNEIVKLFSEVVRVVVDHDAVGIEQIRPLSYENAAEREILMQALDQTGKIVRLHEDHFDYFARRYSYIRRFVPSFLNALTFYSNIPHDPLLKAIDLIRELDKDKSRQQVPKDAPVEFVSKKWNPYVFDKDTGKISRCYYELCMLWELRNSLRSSDIWLENSRRYANPKTYLISPEKWPQLKTEICSLINISQEGSIRLKEREDEMAALLPTVEQLLSCDESPIRFEEGKIIVTPLEAEERPKSAVDLEKQIAQRLPQVEITDLLIEVDGWTRFSDHFEHATKSESRSKQLQTHLYASILAQACNFGLEQMARTTDIPYRRLSWCTTWYLREETLKAAITTLVNFQYHQPFSQYWGDSTLSSSDGQRFPLSVKSRIGRPLPPYFAYGTGLTFNSWTSSQFPQWGIKSAPSTNRDSTYVLDEILDNETELPLFEHTTDTLGYTEIIFALFDLLGLRFSPRLRDIQDQQLYRFGSIDMSSYKFLKQRIKKVINRQLILDHWDDLLRIAGSLKLGWVTASLFIQKLQASSRKSELVKALQEYGRIAKTIHILRWYASEENRRRINRQLNKGEAIHGVRSYLWLANKGQIRRKYEDEIQNQASCLILVTDAVIIWNTVYMAAVIDQLKSEGYPVQESDLAHLWPTRYEHINVHGKYKFNIDEEFNRKGLRPLRKIDTLFS